MTHTTIAGDRPVVIGTIVAAAATREATTIEGADAAQLLDYIRELESIARDYADRQRDGTAGLRRPVLGLAWLMEFRLRRHDGDRGRDAWKTEHPAELMQGVRRQVEGLEEALGDWYAPPTLRAPNAAHRLALQAADVANLAMMVADSVDGLERAGPGQPALRAKNLRHMHRMHDRLGQMLERANRDGQSSANRIGWIASDRNAVGWALQQLDPAKEHLPQPKAQALHGDGSGAALPPVDPTRAQLAQGTGQAMQSI